MSNDAIKYTKTGKIDRRGAPGVKKTQTKRKHKQGKPRVCRVNFKIYKSKRQNKILFKIAKGNQIIWNWCHQQIDDYYKATNKLLPLPELLRRLTIFRNATPELKIVYSSSAQAQATRCHKAWERYIFPDVNGDRHGRPRIKGDDRMTGWEYKTHNSGFVYMNAGQHDAALRAEAEKTDGEIIDDPFAPVEGEDVDMIIKCERRSRSHGRLHISGVGWVKIRGIPRNKITKVLNVSISHKSDGWYASLVVEYTPNRQVDKTLEPVAFDLGLETHVTMAYGPDDFAAIPNTRILNKIRDDLKYSNKKISELEKLPETSRNKRKIILLRAKVARIYRDLERQRTDRSHKISAELVKHPVLITEILNVVSMTESNSVEAKEKRQAKGKVKTPRPGSPATWSAKQKAALNAQVLDTAMGSLLRMIVYKAEEAGSRLVLLDPREHKPSQTCPHCMGQKYKGLEKRDHGCVCGFAATRDESAALVMLRIGLEEIGMGAIPDAWDWNIDEPVVEKDPQNHVLETPTRVALATWSG